MADFMIALKATKGEEGIYSTGTGSTAADTGGETILGIARKKNPQWPGWPLVDSYKPNVLKVLDDPKFKQLVEDFYRQDYWGPIKGSDISSQAVANELFDSAVNMGPSHPAKFLQNTLNLMNKNQTLYPDMVVDGVLGTKTLEALKIVLSKGEEAVVLVSLNGFQFARYVEICKNDPTQEAFFRGWAKRAHARLASATV
jgi:lysozyme family protein